MTSKKGRPRNIYLIDACWRGNALRTYFGYSVEEIRGDDWSDTPYDCNCEIVYPEYVICVLDVLIPFNYEITDVASESGCYENISMCRNDFKTGDVPLFWIKDNSMDHKEDIEFYMGDNKEDVVDKLKLITSILSYKMKKGK